MEAYTNFASVYDTFMSDIPYEEWKDYLKSLLDEYGVTSGTIAELGCGTGTMTQMLSEAGYDMIGLDCSEDMLAIANEKKIQSGQDILYLLQDMRELELYSTVDAMVSVCDSMNYITEPDELKEVFVLVKKYLEDDGVFIFDFKTDFFYREILGDQVIAESQEECSYIWDNYYYEDEKINEYELSLFIKDEELSGTDDVFRRFQETHFQRGYTLEEMKELISEAGLELRACYDVCTRQEPDEESERIYIIAGKGER